MLEHRLASASIKCVGHVCHIGRVTGLDGGAVEIAYPIHRDHPGATHIDDRVGIVWERQSSDCGEPSLEDAAKLVFRLLHRQGESLSSIGSVGGNTRSPGLC